MITINTKPSPQELEIKLSKFKKKIADLIPVHKKIAVFIDAWVGKNFRSEGKLSGGWAPFAYGGRVTTKEKGEAVRNKQGRRIYIDSSAKLLQDKGDLRARFSSVVTKDNVIYGNPLPYSKKHEEGIGVPKRRMLPVIGEVEKDITAIYEAHIDQNKDVL